MHAWELYISRIGQRDYEKGLLTCVFLQDRVQSQMPDTKRNVLPAGLAILRFKNGVI
jgi:hypothetical protein